MDIPGMGNLSDMKGMLDTVKSRIKFPVSKQELIKTLDSVPGIPNQAKELVKQKLPDRTYNSFEELKQAAGM